MFGAANGHVCAKVIVNVAAIRRLPLKHTRTSCPLRLSNSRGAPPSSDQWSEHLSVAASAVHPECSRRERWSTVVNLRQSETQCCYPFTVAEQHIDGLQGKNDGW